ncbi:hypothetical protein MMC31_005575 [Peltigera leucophlebia]|nr:hypothetical protein [Peltigera leucophlebia]
MTIIRLPNILSAVSEIQSRVHDAEKEVTQASEEWFSSYNLIPPAKWDDFVKERFGLCAAMSWPQGGKDSLRTGSDWLILLFKYDDLLDEASSNLMRDERGATKASKIFISAIADTENFQPVPYLPIATACHDFMTRFRAMSPPNVAKRFVDSITSYAIAASKQTGFRERNLRPSVEEYVALRRETGAVMTCMPFIENSLGIDLPDSVLQHPIIEKLHTAANDIVCWGNDITSFNREQAAGDHFNLVAVVALEKGLPVQVALEYVYLMFQSAVSRFENAKFQIPTLDPENHEIVSKYVEGLGFLCSGLTRWYFETDRYFGPNLREVKETMKLHLLPLEKCASRPFQTLTYTVIEY